MPELVDNMAGTITRAFHFPISSSARLLWLYLRFRQADNTVTWPTQEDMSYLVDDDAFVGCAVKELESVGLVAVYAPGSGSVGNRRFWYRTLLPEEAAVEVVTLDWPIGDEYRAVTRQCRSAAALDVDMGLSALAERIDPVRDRNTKALAQTHVMSGFGPYSGE